MNLKVKVNGEWVKLPIYAIVDALHTRFTSTKYTATNVSAALDEVADKAPSEAAKYAALYSYAQILDGLIGADDAYCWYTTALNATAYQENDKRCIYYCADDITNDVYPDGPMTYETIEYEFRAGRLYLFRPADWDLEVFFAPVELTSVEQLESYVHFMDRFN